MRARAQPVSGYRLAAHACGLSEEPCRLGTAPWNRTMVGAVAPGQFLCQHAARAANGHRQAGCAATLPRGRNAGDGKASTIAGQHGLTN